MDRLSSDFPQFSNSQTCSKSKMKILTKPRLYGCKSPLVMWCCVLLFIVSLDVRLVTGNTTPVTSDAQPLTDKDVTNVEKGMRPFFDMVKSFLQIVQPHKLSEQSWLSE